MEAGPGAYRLPRRGPTAITTPSPMRSSKNRWTCASLPTPSSASTAAGASPAIDARTRKPGTPPSPPTCPRRTARPGSGPRSAWNAGRCASARPRHGWSASRLTARRHPQQAYRSCLGILRLGNTYGNDRLNAACRRALTLGSHSYKSIESILRHGLDRQPLAEQTESALPADHDNIRGPAYYH